jgi:hypothetical protein
MSSLRRSCGGKDGSAENNSLNMELKGAPHVRMGWMSSMNVKRLNDFEALGAAPDPEVAPDPKAAEAIGRALEAHYADLIQAPLPDKFLELLARLDDGNQVSEPKGSPDALD